MVGLYRHTGTDYAYDAAALPAGLAIGAVRALRGRGGKPQDVAMPVRDPQTTIAELRTTAAELLPGARIIRRLFVRYTLAWTKGGATKPGGGAP